MSNTVSRYSDADLAEFAALVESKLKKTQEQIDLLQSQIMEITENSSDDFGGDWVDDSSTSSDVEMLNNMAIRQRKHLKDLENAMVRIKNKTYGICVITGELIDKKRLLAVPTTTKSLAAKNNSAAAPKRVRPEPEEKPEKKKKKKKENKVISRIIRKPGSDARPKPVEDDDFDDEDTELDIDRFLDDDEEIDKSFADLDELADEPDEEEED